MDAAEDRSRNDPPASRKIMVRDGRGWQCRPWFRQAWSEAGGRTATVIMDLPETKHLSEVRLSERNQEI